MSSEGVRTPADIEKGLTMDERNVSRREIVRRGLRSGIGLTAALSIALAGAKAAEAATISTTTKPKPSPIPPNCIYVCCDGTCDSWKMCLKCVQWPKATITLAE
jgi:hypothetical protein